MAGLDDVPMSNEGKSALMEREGRLAMEELLEELKPFLETVHEAIDKFEEDPEANGAGTVALIIISLTMDQAARGVMQAAKRFQRRSRL